MIEIKAFITDRWPLCSGQLNQAIKVARKYPGEVEVTKFPAMSEEADKYGIMSCPSLVINEKVVSIGRILSAGDIEKRVKKEMEAPQ